MSDLVKLLTKEPFTRLTRRYLQAAADGQITPAQFLVLTAVADKTVSWRRPWERLSNGDIKAMTGLSHQGVRDAVAALVEINLLVRKPVDNTFAYALVPIGMTGAEVMARWGVDNPARGVNSVEGGLSTELGVSADSTYISLKKDLRRACGPVDKGLMAKAEETCPECLGNGWVVTVEADGFTEAVARCPCTG